jgi:hypothetical protein
MPSKSTPQTPNRKHPGEAPPDNKPVPLTPDEQKQVGGGGDSPRPVPKGGW